MRKPLGKPYLENQKYPQNIHKQKFYEYLKNKNFYSSQIMCFFGQLLAIFFVETSSFVREP